MSASNVVSMPAAASSSSVWPMPPMMPVPGCCPPGGMDALMKCYCDIQSATAFICAVMVDCINTNPAVIQAIIEALQKSGSSLPILGVTDGSNAQPGQVGEFLQATGTVTIPFSQYLPLVSMTVPAGDWDVWGQFIVDNGSVLSTGYHGNLSLVIGGVNEIESTWMSMNLANAIFAGGVIQVGTGRLNTASPVALMLNCSVDGTAGNTFEATGVISARRRR